MIDFHKELARYDFATIDPELTGYLYEATPLIESFRTSLKRVGKELHQNNLQLEELLNATLEEQEKDKVMANHQETIARLENDKLSLVQGLLNVVDQIEDLYRYTLSYDCGERIEQIKLLWKKITAELSKLGISVIEDVDAPFDNNLHAAVEVTANRQYQNRAIMTIIRCGYLYQAKVLRKAQVVVNKIEEGCDDDE
ncbi:MAG: nucleotide exchange factor GrpE [Bacillota bacterium]